MANDLGGQRTGPTGKNDPDVKGVAMAIECKYMQKLSLQATHLKQARTNAGDLPWALLLREAKSGKRLAVIDYKLFVEWYHKIYKEND